MMANNPPAGFSGVISFERPYKKEGAPPCGIYLVAPDIDQPKLFAEQLRHVFSALNSSQYQRNMHVLEMHFPEAVYEKERETATAIVALCKRNGIVPVIRKNLGLFVESDAEGVLVDIFGEIAQARQIVGSEGILGIDCGSDKQKAESALKVGIDYAVIHESLLPWWSTFTHLPAAVSGNYDDPNAVIRLVKNGAGFLRAGDWVWDHAEGPQRAIYWLQEMIDHGLSQQTVN
jgi:hypothetical protein